jgi:formylglycine-generating enzyme required for sulfatase activity
VFAAFPFASAFADTPVAVVAPVETTDEIKREFSGQIETIHDIISGELANSKVMRITSRSEDVKNAIIEEYTAQVEYWSSDEKTAKLGERLNAKFVIVIKIQKNPYILMAKVIDVQSFEEIAMHRKNVRNIDDILTNELFLRDFVKELVEKITGVPSIPISGIPSLSNGANRVSQTMENFVRIKSGTFSMGSSFEPGRNLDESPNPYVTISDFLMCKYEVTQSEYERLMGKNPSHFKNEKLPVENITWFDAIEYCNKRSEVEGLNLVYFPTYHLYENGERKYISVEWKPENNGYRLPTEAEWEYACRAGTTTPFNTEKIMSVELANYNGMNMVSQKFEKGKGKTTPVTEYSPNKFGLYNMHGNVAEWCWDWKDNYTHQNKKNPSGPDTGEKRVIRGGSWNSEAVHIRSAYRGELEPHKSNYETGFRVVRNIQ